MRKICPAMNSSSSVLTCEPGATHIDGMFVFYLDEVSWSVLVEESYSTRGTLWPVVMHGLVQNYDVPLAWYNFSLYHDLDSDSYLIAGLDNEIAKPSHLKVKGRNADFQPNAQR